MRYRDLFSNREFLSTYVADVQSVVGSNLARIAVAALVFARTNSTALTAAAFAISFAPYLFSPWLSTFADLVPRRRLLVVGDFVRAALVTAILVPQLSIPLILMLLFLVELVTVPFGASRIALLSEILTADRFPLGNALVTSTRQILQVAGFALGGVLVGVIGARPTIAIDAVTYVISAVILRVCLVARPAPWRVAGVAPVRPLTGRHRAGALRTGRPNTWTSMKEGLRMIVSTPRMRYLFSMLGIGPAVLVVSEGLAVPWAHQLEGSAALAGLIMAAPPLGNATGLLFFGRLSFDTQQRLVGPLAVGGAVAVGLTGMLSWMSASRVLIIGVLVVAGGSLSYLSAVQSEVARTIPTHTRGRVFGLGNAVMQLSQGAAVAIAGLLAASVHVASALVATGMLGATATLIVALRMPVPTQRVPVAA